MTLYRKPSTRQKKFLDERHFPAADPSCMDVWKRAPSAAAFDQRDPVIGPLKRREHDLRWLYLPAVQAGDPGRDPGGPAEVREIQSEFRQRV